MSSEKDPSKGLFWDGPPEHSAQDAREGMRDYRIAKESELRATEIRAGIVHHRSSTAVPADIVLEVASSSDVTVQLHYLVEPYLPMNQVVGYYGRGGTAKSSFVATLAAQISSDSSTLWVSTEEDVQWIKVRHIRTGGKEGTMYVFKALVTATDSTGKPTASTFDVYQHLDATIARAKLDTATCAGAADNAAPPVRLVVLDTAVALTTWGRGESANDDASVKRLIAYLYSLCDKHCVTIAIIGHNNKGKHDFLGDTVAGSGSWTSSLRQAFVHLNDHRDEYRYVLCTVKDTLTGPFATEYATVPVHTLHKRVDGSDSVLCSVITGQIHWGHRSVRKLFDDATGRESADDARPSTASRRQMQIDLVVTTLVRLLDSGAPTATRKDVQEIIGTAINARHWQDADTVLALTHGVRATTGAHGVLTYQRTVTH